jgi:hypothetical protein
MVKSRDGDVVSCIADMAGQMIPWWSFSKFRNNPEMNTLN